MKSKKTPRSRPSPTGERGEKRRKAPGPQNAKERQHDRGAGKPGRAGDTSAPRTSEPSVPREAGEGERIAKRLARAGVASRRDAEAMVAAGRVKVNGRVLNSPAFNVRPSDRIEVDGAPIPEAERTRLFLLHKPAGVVTTSRDPEGRKTVFDILPPELPRLITVGRLDINTEGLLLLTNDGGLARILELPSTGWLRRYRVRVHGNVDPLALAELEQGTAVDGVFYGAIEATLDRKQGSNAWLTLGLREGKNREVKNVLGALGLDVTRLIRVSYGPFQLGSLPEGAVQEIKGRTLRDQLGERLIEEAGANFEAPIAHPFSNTPVRAGRPAAAQEPRKERAPGAEAPKARPATGRKKSRQDSREEMRDRLQTQPPRRAGEERRSERPQRKQTPAKGKAAENGQMPAKGKPPARKDARPLERRSRAANVWMAPGARPMGPKKAEEAAGAERGKEGAGRQTGRKERSDTKGGGREDRFRRERAPERGKPRGGKGRKGS